MKKIFFFLLCAGLCSCQKEEVSEITVETLPVSVQYDPETQKAVVDVSAAISGDESSIHERGFILSKENPYDTESVTPVQDGAPFSLTYEDLEIGKVYYVKAYVRTYSGPRYGKNLQFTIAVEPIFENTTEDSDVFGNYMLAKGKLLSTGGGDIARCGFRISFGQESETFEAELPDDEGNFSAIISGLEPETEYELSVFVENILGETTGAALKLKTKKFELPVAEIDQTTPFPYIGSESVTVRVSLSSDGNDADARYGVRWGEDEASLDNTVYSSAEGTSGDVIVSGLETGKTYYFAAYAENAAGHRLGTEIKSTATRMEYPPVVTTTEPVRQKDYFASRAILRGVITETGGRDIEEYGFYLGTSPDALTRKIVSDNLDGTGSFSAELEDLTPLTEYWYMAFADNGEESADTEIRHFVTGIADRDVYLRDAEMNFTDELLVYWTLEPIQATVDGETVSLEFLDRNLGAVKTAASVAYDRDAAGYYYKWGSSYPQVSPAMAALKEGNNIPEKDGVKFNGWGEQPWYQENATTTWTELSQTDPSAWRNPCPDGFHVPSRAEWLAAFSATGCKDANTAFTIFGLCRSGAFGPEGNHTNTNMYMMWTDDAKNDRSEMIVSTRLNQTSDLTARNRALPVRCVRNYR